MEYNDYNMNFNNDNAYIICLHNLQTEDEYIVITISMSNNEICYFICTNSKVEKND